MNARQRIQKALHTIMSDGEANACAVYKGYDYNGAAQGTGWWYRPFNSTPGWLGTSITEALATIEEIKDEQHAMARDAGYRTAAEAAARLGISARRVRAIIAAGDLPAYKIGWGWLIHGDALAEFAARPRPAGRPSR